MIDILMEADALKKKAGGWENKLCIEDQLLMTLEYLREYRTYFHIGNNFGISESSANKGIKWAEETLVKTPDFALPCGNPLLNSDVEYEIIMIDATETPCERPKKAEKYYSGNKKDTL